MTLMRHVILNCDFCGNKIKRLYYENIYKEIACPRCFKACWRTKELDPDSTKGISYMTDVLVAKKLGIQLNANKTGKLHNFVDMIHPKLGNIKAAGAKLDMRSKHNFLIVKPYVNKIDTYIFIGYDEERRHILRVYIVPIGFIRKHFNVRYSDTTYKKMSISLNNKNKMLVFRQDEKEWDDFFHTLSLSNCPVLGKRNRFKI